MKFNELKQAVKNRPEDLQNWTDIYFYKKISIYLTWLFLKIGVSANTVTISSIFVGLVGGIFLTFNTKWSWVVGALFFILFLLVDYCDGAVARCRQESSPTGLFIELIAHYFIDVFLFGGLMIGVYRQNPHPIVLMLGVLLILSVLMLKVRSVVTWQAISAEHLRSQTRMQNAGVNSAVQYLVNLQNVGRAVTVSRARKGIIRRIIGRLLDFDVNQISIFFVFSLFNLFGWQVVYRGFAIRTLEIYFVCVLLASFFLMVRALYLHIKYRQTERAYQDFFIDKNKQMDFWF